MAAADEACVTQLACRTTAMLSGRDAALGGGREPLAASSLPGAIFGAVTGARRSRGATAKPDASVARVVALATGCLLLANLAASVWVLTSASCIVNGWKERMVLPAVPPTPLATGVGNASGTSPLVLMFTTLRPVDRTGDTAPPRAASNASAPGEPMQVAPSPPDEGVASISDVEERVVGACQANAVRALLALRATGVRVLVFTSDARVQRWLSHVGAEWSSEHQENEFGLPFVGSMWALAEQRRAAIGAPFIGYANADILFAPDLAHTLGALWSHVRAGNVHPHTMLVGLRRNAYVHRFPAVVAEHPFEVIAKAGPGSVAAAVSAIAAASPYAPGTAEDWFVTTPSSVDWRDAPLRDFVVGRVGWDNWLVDRMHRDADVTVVDATRTVTAVHQAELRVFTDLAASGGVAAASGPARHGGTNKDELWNTEAIRASGKAMETLGDVSPTTCDLMTQFADREPLSVLGILQQPQMPVPRPIVFVRTGPSPCSSVWDVCTAVWVASAALAFCREVSKEWCWRWGPYRSLALRVSRATQRLGLGRHGAQLKKHDTTGGGQLGAAAARSSRTRGGGTAVEHAAVEDDDASRRELDAALASV